MTVTITMMMTMRKMRKEEDASRMMAKTMIIDNYDDGDLDEKEGGVDQVLPPKTCSTGHKLWEKHGTPNEISFQPRVFHGILASRMPGIMPP